MSDASESQAQDQSATSTAGDSAASTSQTVEQVQSNDTSAATPEVVEQPPKEPSLQEKMKERAQQNAGEKAEKQNKQSANGQADPSQEKSEVVNEQGKPPAFEPNYKYKAFGKEKELDPLFRSLIKDPESERKVKEVFTRADAFDDMKSRYEGVSQEFQRVAKTHQDLDKDVKRVMTFRNNGDLDNFFAALQIPKEDIFKYAARQIELEKLGPAQQAEYNQAVSLRAENLYNQQNFASMQQQMAEQRAQVMQMQLDHTLSKSEISPAASNWDARMGEGAFRNLVIEEAAKNTYATGQVWTPEQAVQNVMQKFGKLLENPQPQATVQAQTVNQNYHQSTPAPQAQGPVVVQGKPVIPNVNGRGTSPVKQKPKSLADLREMGRQARQADFQAYES